MLSQLCALTSGVEYPVCSMQDRHGLLQKARQAQSDRQADAYLQHQDNAAHGWQYSMNVLGSSEAFMSTFGTELGCSGDGWFCISSSTGMSSTGMAGCTRVFFCGNFWSHHLEAFCTFSFLHQSSVQTSMLIDVCPHFTTEASRAPSYC